MSYLNSLFQQISTSINRPISDFEAFIKMYPPHNLVSNKTGSTPNKQSDK